MAYAIKHLFHINAPREKVYQALTSIHGLSQWWTKETSGSSNEGGTIQFRFGGQGPDMKVAGLKPNEQVTWECVSGHDDWLGNTITFNLDENEGKTRIRFAHDGWDKQDDFYSICSFSWGRYLESLRQYSQKGIGEGFGQ